MEQTQYLLNAPGGTVTKEDARCFVRQLLQDLKNERPKIKWARDKDSEWGTFYSHGLSGDSYIQVKSSRHKKQWIVCMSYEKGHKFVYSLIELNLQSDSPGILAQLYKQVAATVKHQTIYGNSNIKKSDTKLSVDEMNDWCLKVNELFRAVSVDQVVAHLMNRPSTANVNISEGSPEWQRREQQIRNLIQTIQYTRNRESSLILDGFALKKANGQICGHITTDPIAKWSNAHIIVRPERYTGLPFNEIRVKVASDIIANLLTIL